MGTPECPAPNACYRAQPSRLATNMIIISESSAEATQPLRTGRYPPTRRHSSAACNDTARYANIRPISVHTEVLAGPLPPYRSRDCPTPLRVDRLAATASRERSRRMECRVFHRPQGSSVRVYRLPGQRSHELFFTLSHSRPTYSLRCWEASSLFRRPG